MVAAVVEERADKEKNHVESTTDLCFEQAAYAVVGEEASESMQAVGREEVDVEACGRRLLLNGGKDGDGVLEDGDVHANEKEFDWKAAVVMTRISNLKRSMAASVKSSKTPR